MPVWHTAYVCEFNEVRNDKPYTKTESERDELKQNNATLAKQLDQVQNMYRHLQIENGILNSGDTVYRRF